MSTRPGTHPLPAAVPPLLQTGIGVVAPYDFALDRELWRWVPDDVTLHITRTPYAPMAATVEMAVHISDPELIAQTTCNVLAVAPLAVAYACTFGSFVGGLTGEQALVDAMVRAGAPAAVTTSGALVLALRRLGISRIATVTPYTNDLTAGLTAFLAEAGIEVVATAGLGLIAQIWAVPYETTVELVRGIDSPAADAIFISCTNLPTYDVIAGLEATLGKPVLTANQVTMWSALELTGHHATGPGQRLLADHQHLRSDEFPSHPRPDDLAAGSPHDLAGGPTGGSTGGSPGGSAGGPTGGSAACLRDVLPEALSRSCSAEPDVAGRGVQSV